MVDEVNPDRLDEVADALGRESDLHLLLVDVGGAVIADSDSEPGDAPPPVQSWPEVADVLGVASSTHGRNIPGSRTTTCCRWPGRGGT